MKLKGKAMTERYTLPIPFGWYCVAYSEEITTGRVLPLHYFGQELAIYRTEGGEVCVSDAYCPHLGAHIGYGGNVIGEHISCPFHGWEFTASGRCGHIPYAKNRPEKSKEEQFIFQYPVVESNGIIWVWYHPGRNAPLFDVQHHPEIENGEWHTDYQKEAWIINTVVQETAENACDTAHFKSVHNSYGIPQANVNYAAHQRSTNIEGALVGEGKEGPEDFTFKMLSANNGPGHTWQHFTGNFDSFMLGLITPIDSQSLILRFAFANKKTHSEAEAALSASYVDEVIRQVQQDIPIWNHKTFRAEPVLCDGDGPIAQFRKWFSQFYAG